jgi:hypothetical protein
MSGLTIFHVLRFQYHNKAGADKKPVAHRSYNSETILGQVFRCSDGEAIAAKEREALD